MFSLLYTRGRYYASSEGVQNLPNENTDERHAETSDLICKQMHVKNNAINNNENCIMLLSEMSIKEVE